MKTFDIKKSYDRFSLDVRNFELRPGKIHGLIGPNGCGKTTLMKILAGLLSPDSGSIDSEGLAPRDITMVFRKPYLLHDTVVQNLLYPLRIRKITPDEDLVDHYLGISNLQSYRDQYAPGLSAGEQQRLAIIRALIFSPKLILIDEAFSSMDIESFAFFTDYILRMQKTNPATWLVISHQLSCIKKLCEYVFFMYDGKIEAQGEPALLLNEPGNENLKRFLHYI